MSVEDEGDVKDRRRGLRFHTGLLIRVIIRAYKSHTTSSPPPTCRGIPESITGTRPQEPCECLNVHRSADVPLIMGGFSHRDVTFPIS